jgi:hypothetical protein
MQEPINLEFYRDNPLVRDVLRVMARLQAFKEEARAFYAGRDTDLRRLVADWPGDVRDHLDELLRHCRELAPA